MTDDKDRISEAVWERVRCLEAEVREQSNDLYLSDAQLAARAFRGDLDPVLKLHTQNYLWQQVMTVEAAPVPLRVLDELEYHGERGLVRKAPLRANGVVAHRRERSHSSKPRCHTGAGAESRAAKYPAGGRPRRAGPPASRGAPRTGSVPAGTVRRRLIPASRDAGPGSTPRRTPAKPPGASRGGRSRRA
jgi:hypothetical protein